MEVTWASTSEEGAAKSEQRQGHVTVFLDHEGVVHHEYAPPGQTITKDYNIEVFRRLRDAVRSKRQQLWASGDGIFITKKRPPILQLSFRLFW